MRRGLMVRLWGGLSLTQRLMAGSGAALVAGSAAFLFSIVDSALENHRRGLADNARHEIAFVVPAITEQALIGDYTLIEQMLKTRAAQPNIARVGWVDARGNPIIAGGSPTPGNAPAWFVRWADLPAEEFAREIEVGGVSYGKVVLQMDPAPILDLAWSQSVEKLQLVLLAIVVLFCVTLAIARSSLRPLVAFAEAARRFGQGDYSVRVPGRGSPEVQASIQAFNSMAGNLQTLFNSLRESQAVLSEEKERAQVTLASIADAVATTDAEGRVEYLNPVAEKLTGWSLEEARAQPLAVIFNVILEKTQDVAEDPVRAALAGRASDAIRHALLISKSGRQCHIEHSAAPILQHGAGAIGAVLVFRDVGEARKMAHQLSWQATHDALTGLVNRAEFERRLELLVLQANTDGTSHTMLYLDLDQFKVVNDTCGHVAGDELLRQLAPLLHKSIRDSDTLARLGGDEFGVLLYGCAMERALQLAEHMRQDVTEFRFAWQGKTFVIGISIGVVAITGAGQQSAAILAAADAACYSAKDKGRNRVQAYLPDDRELAQRHGEMQWVSRLNHAFEEDRFRLHAQRIVPVAGDAGELHFELLVRMIGEDGRLVPPMAFIPAAERYNLMPALDRRIIQRALDACRALHDARGGVAATMSINLSGASLNDERFLEFVFEQFGQSGVPAAMICFEITETLAIANLARATTLMTEIRRLGCKFSLDDFGSGLSSFAYLKHLPVDYLKIDGAFVKDMATDPIDLAMVRAISDVGHVMGIKTVAEWVENDETLALLREIGVDYAQGFGVERPRPLEEVIGSPVQSATRRLPSLATGKGS